MNIIEKNIIGQSASILDLKENIKSLSNYTATLLISGETGTGKELVARGLHYSGCLSRKPFIAINCSTFTDELFISELFGYKKGAFTDAKNDKEGLLSSANGGTIFLDEIDSLSLKSQASLLRVLQESEYRPIGSNETLKVNVRFIVATNSNLEEKIKEGLFRQDLYFRIFILSISIPPLRERKSDIPLLVKHFIDKLNCQYLLNRTSVTADSMAYLTSQSWPGNIRELENCIHRHYLLSKDELIDIQSSDKKFIKDTPPTITEPHLSLNDTMTFTLPLMENNADELLNFSDAKRAAIETFEAKFVSRILYVCDGNVTQAAKLCGKERRAFGKMVKKYNIKNNEVNIL